MSSSSRSLLDFLDAPVLVGDPDGRAVYVNPAFESRFGLKAADATGVPLAELFGGGGREGVLRAVASVCGGEGTVQFRVREAGQAFAALASPIVAETDRVGVVILLTPELAGDDRLLGLHRKLQEPLDEIDRCLGELLDGASSDRTHACAEDAARALARMRKWVAEIHRMIDGSSR